MLWAAVKSNARLGSGWVIANPQPLGFYNLQRRPNALPTKRAHRRVEALEDGADRLIARTERADRATRCLVSLIAVEARRSHPRRLAPLRTRGFAPPMVNADDAIPGAPAS